MSYDLPDLPDVFIGGQVELDVPVLDTGVKVEAAIELDGDDTDRAKAAKHAQRLEWYTPRSLRVPFGMNITGAVGGSAALVAALPSMGRKLDIKRIYINLAAPVSQSLPTIEFYLVSQSHGFNTGGANPTDPLNLSSANILWSWKQALPVQQVWGTDQITIYYPERPMLVGWIGGAVAAFQVAGSISVIDRPIDELRSGSYVR